MKVEEFLDLLDGVKTTGRGRWAARCPAHPDRNPSLSIAEGDDHRILLKCFAGCSAFEVCGALGIDVTDLFPEALRDGRPLQKSRRSSGMPPAADCLKMLADSAFVVEYCGYIFRAGKQLDDVQDREFERALSHISAIRREWMAAR